ncbi:hypothetical protein RF11_16495 [Thelohanellus kitauei]|uniref:Uncharacterized protein n=1 Tax=Thelohanellus kitauei TaxID=669202 RepID=A0A0C2J3K5_THEKT|nr:hypothetical protein RF11_16495 [Thelohanellus kitauei]
MSSTNTPVNNDIVVEEFNFKNEDGITRLKTLNFLSKHIGEKQFKMIIDHFRNHDFKKVTYDMIKKLVDSRYVKRTNFAYQPFVFHTAFQDKNADISKFFGRHKDRKTL